MRLATPLVLKISFKYYFLFDLTSSSQKITDLNKINGTIFAFLMLQICHHA